MSHHNRMKSQWGHKKLKRLMKRADKKIAPYRDKMDSPDGMFARLFISGMAMIVAEGKGSRENFKEAIISASEIAGVPVSVMTAHGDVILAMITGGMQSQRTSPFVGGK
jgi:hypothetical protein